MRRRRQQGRHPQAVVRNGEVALAATDHGGEGPDLVLMHGLGQSQRALDKVVDRLPGWRVITMDLRGHGRSTTASWDFPNAISDLQAVIDHFQLEDAYVGGHSLGGMVALQYALRERAASGVINIDGWGPGVAGRYVGEDVEAVEAVLDQIARGHLPTRRARAVVAISRQRREGTTGQVLTVIDKADVVAWHAAAPCPSLAFNAVAASGKGVDWLMGATMARMQSSHRQGLRRDLAATSREREDVTVVEIDATHQLISTHPDQVASAINTFGDRLG